MITRNFLKIGKTSLQNPKTFKFHPMSLNLTGSYLNRNFSLFSLNYRQNYQFTNLSQNRSFSTAENPIADPYKTLGIPRTASKEDIKKAFGKMAKTYHPDKDIGNEEKFRKILQAYHVLNDATRKAHYDAKLNTSEGNASSYTK